MRADLLCFSVDNDSVGFQINTVSKLVETDTASVLLSYIKKTYELLDKEDYNAVTEILDEVIEKYENADPAQFIDIALIYSLHGYNYYVNYNNYQKAVEYYSKADELYNSFEHEYRVNHLLCRKNLGYCNYFLSNYDEALYYFNSLLKEDTILTKINTSKAELFKLIGEVNMDKYDHEAAYLYFQLALERYKNNLDKKGEIYIYCDLGLLSISLHDYQNALNYFTRGIKMLLAHDETVLWLLLTLYNNMGVVYELQYNYYEALKYYKLAYSFHDDTSNKENVCYLLSNIGLCYGYTGVKDSSEYYFDKALKLAEHYFNEPALVFSKIHYYRSLYYRYTKDNEDFNNSIDKAFQNNLLYAEKESSISEFTMNDQFISLPHLLDITLLKAETDYDIYLSGNDTSFLNNSLSQYQKSFEILEYIRGRYHFEYTKLLLNKSFLNRLEKIFIIMCDIYLINSGINSEAMYEYTERIKSAVLYQYIHRSKYPDQLNVNDSILQKKKDLNIELDNLYSRQLMLLKRSNEETKSEISVINEAILDKREEIQQFETRINFLYNKNEIIVNTRDHINSEMIRESLELNECILNYIIVESSLIIQTVKKDTILYTRNNLPGDFERMTKTYFKNIKKLNFENSKEQNRQIFETLISPVYDQLSGIKKLIIIPDEYLYYLPFETLLISVAGERLKFLIEDFSVSYHYSVSTWYNTHITSGNKYPATFYAFAPVFTTNEVNDLLVQPKHVLSFSDSTLQSSFSSDRSIKPLPNSETEIREISKILSRHNINSTLFIKDSATESNFKSVVPGADIIHVATHGFSDDRVTFLSGLLFYSTVSDNNNISETDYLYQNTYNDDGILFVREINNLDINANLVVLSSCESGIGQNIHGEGLISLNRAFYAAGASNVVFSMWKMLDEQTKYFMTEFYKNFGTNNFNYEDALQKTKLSFIENKSLQDPYFWAGFLLFGK